MTNTSINNKQYTSFINDIDKVADLLAIQDRRRFLQSYSYLTEEEYDLTLLDLRKPEEIAYLWREAENLNIEEINGRPTPYNVTADELKTLLLQYTNAFFTKEELDDMIDMCTGMAC